MRVLVAALLLVVAFAAPAQAHTRASTATDLASRIEQAPDLPGVSWRLYAGGEYLEVENRSDAELVVLGYEGEPYLRVDSSGVHRNRNAPTAYLNLERYGDVALPPRADAGAEPEWVQVSSRPRYAWYDHRVHWMPGDDVTGPHAWEVPFMVAGQRHVLSGEWRYEPGPVIWPWLAAGLAVVALAAARVRRSGDPQARVRLAAALVAAVALFNLVHLPDEVAALPLPAMDVAFGILHNVLFIGAGLAGAALAWRMKGAQLLPLGVGAGAVLFHQGLLQTQQLGASQLATIWPAWVIRLAVALSLAQALWVGVVILQRLTDRTAGAEAPSAGEGPLVPAGMGRPSS